MKESQSFSDIITSKSTQPQSFPGIYRIYECIIISLEMLVGKKKSDHLMQWFRSHSNFVFNQKEPSEKLQLHLAIAWLTKLTVHCFNVRLLAEKFVAKSLPSLPPPLHPAIPSGSGWMRCASVRKLKNAISN